jgi:sodium borate transporter 11
MYGCVGLWCAFFLLIFSLFNVSRLMHWCTRSTEEIFGLFISVAFCVDACRDTAKSQLFLNFSLGISLFKSFSICFLLCADFQKNFYSSQCQGENAITNITNSLSSSLTFNSWNDTRANDSVEAITYPNEEPMGVECNQASSVLFLLLMLGTVWLGVSIFNFKKTYGDIL